MPYIRIAKIDGEWAAMLYGGSAETAKLFLEGARPTISLPYSSKVRLEEILRDLRARNPKLDIRR